MIQQKYRESVLLKLKGALHFRYKNVIIKKKDEMFVLTLLS